MFYKIFHLRPEFVKVFEFLSKPKLYLTVTAVSAHCSGVDWTAAGQGERGGARPDSYKLLSFLLIAKNKVKPTVFREFNKRQEFLKD